MTTQSNVEEIVREFQESWTNPTLGRYHNPKIPAFYNPGAEEGDEQSWDETKIEGWLRERLAALLTTTSKRIVERLEIEKEGDDNDYDAALTRAQEIVESEIKKIAA